MAYVDLDEIEALCSRSLFWSCRKWSPFSIRREDYFGDATVTLKQAVYEKVRENLNFVPQGPVRMLTNPRCFGLRMNPITVFYVFDLAGENIVAVLAEVTNTPWDVRHVYVMDYRDGTASTEKHFGKELHVSPFFQKQQKYIWQTNLPAQLLRIHLQSVAVSEEPQLEELGPMRKSFEAVLVLQRQACSGKNLTRLLWRFPWMTGKVLFGIYWQALNLYLKGARFYKWVQ